MAEYQNKKNNGLITLQKLTEQYKMQEQKSTWEENIKRGFNETLAAITAAKADLKAQI